MKLTTTEKSFAGIIILVIAIWATDLLNYKDWLLFGAGVAIEILCVILLFTILITFFKSKTNKNE